MENITLGQIATAMAFVVGFLISIEYIMKYIKKQFDNIINKELEPLNKKVSKIDENQCRNFLVDFLADVEQGTEKDDVQIKRAYEVYEHYTNDLHQNSYIHNKWEKIMK